MRLLLDENLSPRLAEFLRLAGYDVVHVRDIALTSAADEVVLSAAVSDRRVLVSADTDFGTLLASTGATLPSVVLLRRASTRRAAEQATLLIDNLPAVEDDLNAGAVVVLGEQVIRIRRLPIGGSLGRTK
jgi:predicted nuclease of predicted toxin-antitoxin system